MKKIYRWLLALFPQDYRNCFENEMLATFDQACAERRALGAVAFGRFVCAELAGLAISAPFEWMAKLTTSSWIRARSVPDLRMMRPAGVPREVWFAQGVPDEIAEAEKRVEFCLRRMEHAIATHDFVGARYYSDEDLKARADLRAARAKYGLGD